MSSGAAAVAAPGVARNRFSGECVGMIPAVPQDLDRFRAEGAIMAPRATAGAAPGGGGRLVAAR